MDETSRLIVAVDSTSVPKAQTELDAYTASAAKADAATKSLGDTSRTAADAHAATADGLTQAEQAASKYAESEAEAAARIHDMIQASLAATEASKAQATAQAAAAAKTAESNAASIAASKALADAQTRQMAAYTAARAPVVELEAILEKTTLTTAEVAKAEALLDKAQASGIISAGELTAAFKALDAAKIKDIAVTEAQTAANKSALNSRATSEIATGISEVLAGNPARLRRTGAAFANQAGVFKAMFTPVGLGITAAVAALGIFGKAVYDREQDLLNFNKALAATGDFAGTSGQQLQGIAEIVGESTNDYSNATKAVLALAQSGQVVGSQMQRMATTAVNMAYLTGQSVESIVKELISLQGDPTQAIVKLTSAMGLLTTAQYNQIVVTQQTQGANAAAALAMKDLADASDQARAKLVDNAGVVIRAWEGFKNLLSETGHLIASVGATQSTGELLAIQQKRLQMLNDQVTPTNQVDKSPTWQRQVADAKAQIAALQQQQNSDAMFAAGQELANQGKEAHDKALAEALASTKQGTEGFVEQAAAINKKRYEALIGIVDPSIRDRINAAYDQQIRDAVNRANSEFRGGSSGGVTHKTKTDPLAGLSNMVAGLTTKSIGVEGDTALTAYVQGIAKLDDEFDKAIAKGASVTAATEKYEEGVKALGDTLDNTRKKQQALTDEATSRFKDQLDAQNAAMQRSIDLQVASVGMSQKEIQRAQQLQQIREQGIQTLKRLEAEETQAIAQAGPDADTSKIKAIYDKRMQLAKEAVDQQVAMTEDGYKRMDDAQSDWLLGMQSAVKEFMDAQQNVAAQSKQFTTDFINGFGDAFAQFASGTESAKKAFGSFIDSMYQQALKFLANKALQELLGSFGHSNGFGMTDSSGGFSQSAADSTAGNIVDSIYGSGGSSSGGFWSSVGGFIGSLFNSGGRASGGPVDAGHLYRVNEDGPELLTVGGKSYLMMGRDSGNVTPNNATAKPYGGNRTTINVQVQPTSSRRSADQIAQQIARKQALATMRNG